MFPERLQNPAQNIYYWTIDALALSQSAVDSNLKINLVMPNNRHYFLASVLSQLMEC